MENIKNIIYLDNNATTQVDKRVLNAMMPFLTTEFANSNSNHAFGESINKSIRLSRAKVANSIGAETNEIVFTSGSTEAINIAIKGVAEKCFEIGRQIIIVKTEHPAVLESCKYLETKGFDITYLSVDSDGLIDLTELKAALSNNTILVAVMYVNNETGVIQPIQEIAKLAHEVGALFMTDATQAIGKIPIDVVSNGIDLLCLSGHKIYAPKGIGALYINKRINLLPQIHGGGQENGLRSGTLNVPGIIALGVACEIAQEEMNSDKERIEVLRNLLETELLEIPSTFINGSIVKRVCNVSNICFQGFNANVMIGRMKMLAVSNGSACTSSIFEPSFVLIAMGLSDEDAFSSIRFSLGRFNTEYDVRTAARMIRESII